MLVDIDIIMRVFMKKTSYQMSINRGERPQLKVPCKPCENSLLTYLSLLVKSFEEEIKSSRDRIDIARC